MNSEEGNAEIARYLGVDAGVQVYIYGYLNRIQSTRRLERETGRNVELIWLLGRLAPDLKANLLKGSN